MVGFKFEGLNDIQRFLDNYKKDHERQIFDEWATRVTKTAKELCNDPDCKRIRLVEQQEEENEKDTGNISLNVEFADKEAVNCMLKAIAKLQGSMPPSLQLIYDAIKSQLQAMKAEFGK